jgi:hypothetical protein
VLPPTVDVVGNDGAMLWSVEDPGLQALAAEMLVRRRGIEYDEALRRLEFHDAASEVLGEIRRLLGDRDGGMWFDGVGRLNIGVVRRGGGIAGPRLARVTSLLTPHGLMDGTSFVAVDYSEQQLSDAQSAMTDELIDLYRAGKIASGLTSSENAVHVDMDTTITAAERARVERVAQRAPVRVLLRQTTLDTVIELHV